MFAGTISSKMFNFYPNGVRVRPTLIRSTWASFVLLAFGLTTLVQVSTTQNSYAHSGGTDAFGCHAGRLPYHCHNAKNSSSGSYGNNSTPNWAPPIQPSFCISPDTSTLTNSDIALIQNVLAQKGYRPGPIDGNYGSQTQAALNRFERKRGLRLSTRTKLSGLTLTRLDVRC